MDTFRKKYRPLTEEQKEMVLKIKSKAEELEKLFDDANISDMEREFSLAKYNLEQSVMWAVKGVTK